MDFLPTFLAAAGGTPDLEYPSDGVDIRSALTGGALPERMLFWRYRNKDQKAVRQGRYKYLSIGATSSCSTSSPIRSSAATSGCGCPTSSRR